mmetsp:Transcript_27238/g.49863  ORF Transcript_27238/g.49863 Transcript_27238/m.49863 type:complete len:218 (+) Transcript_27238:4443-5096(+)
MPLAKFQVPSTGSMIKLNSASPRPSISAGVLEIASSPRTSAWGNAICSPRVIIASAAKSASVTRSVSSFLVAMSPASSLRKRGMISARAARRTRLRSCVFCAFVSGAVTGMGNWSVMAGPLVIPVLGVGCAMRAALRQCSRVPGGIGCLFTPAQDLGGAGGQWAPSESKPRQERSHDPACDNGQRRGPDDREIGIHHKVADGPATCDSGGEGDDART